MLLHSVPPQNSRCMLMCTSLICSRPYSPFTRMLMAHSSPTSPLYTDAYGTLQPHIPPLHGCLWHTPAPHPPFTRMLMAHSSPTSPLYTDAYGTLQPHIPPLHGCLWHTPAPHPPFTWMLMAHSSPTTIPCATFGLFYTHAYIRTLKFRLIAVS